MSDYLEELKDVIRQLLGAEATYVKSIPGTEQFGGATVWDGVVEVFDLYGHPAVPRVYAWSHDTADPSQPKEHVTVLHLSPVLSAALAVRAAIAQEFGNAVIIVN